MDGVSRHRGATGLLDEVRPAAHLTTPVRVATWNVQEGLPEGSRDERDRSRALEELTQTVRQHHIDVLALQEVDFRDGRSEVLDALSRHTDLKHSHHLVLSDSSFFPGSRAGVAVAGRYPLVRREQFELPNPDLRGTLGGREIRSHDKGAVVGTFRIGHRQLTVMSLHMVPFHVFRTDPSELTDVWERLDKEVAVHRPASGPTVVCGDFNTDRRELAVPTGGFHRTIDKVTHRGFACDDILIPDGMALDGTDTVPGFSDHLLCLADLKVA